MAQNEPAFVECNNEKCPQHKDGVCHSLDPIEIFFHPNYPSSFSCWWDDNGVDDEE